MKIKNLFVFLMVSLVCASISSGQTLRPGDYKIGPRDELEISVIDVKELQKIRIRVTEDGKIILPLLGEIVVEGLTGTQLERRIAQLAEQRIISNPQVSVYMVDFASKRVLIMGAVKNPGSQALLGRMRLVRAIAEAGDFTADAGNKILITRELADGSSSIITVSREELFIKGDTRFNLPLEPNDVVYVPVDKKVTIYVMGQVRSPGAHEIKESKLPTLLQMIAIAGGLTDRASKRGITVQWTDENGKKQKKKYNLSDIEKMRVTDPILKADYMVIVGESIW
ncbi:polysaccharide biosynthesis/export family protein [Acidobacteriota bacterium]